MIARPRSKEDDAYWETWREHYRILGRSEDYDLIHRDGVVELDRFLAARRKVLFVLKEPNHEKKAKKGGDIRGWLKEPVGRSGVALRHNLARWAAALHHDFKPASPEETGIALLGSAVINLKKVEGGRRADMGVIGFYAGMDRQLLREQIRMINPNIIVAGGTFTILSRLLDLDTKWSQVAIRCPDYGEWVIPMTHPAYIRSHDSSTKVLEIAARPWLEARGNL